MSVRYLTFAISFPSNYNYKSRTMAGYFLTDTLVKNAKSGTTYSVFDANNNELGTKFRVYAEVIEFSNNNLQSLRFSNDKTEWNSVATLDLHIEIVVPKSVNIKCLNQLTTK